MSKPASCLLFAVAAVILAAIPLAAAVAQPSPDITRLSPRGSSGALPGGNVVTIPDGPPTDNITKPGTSTVTITTGGGSSPTPEPPPPPPQPAPSPIYVNSIGIETPFYHEKFDGYPEPISIDSEGDMRLAWNELERLSQLWSHYAAYTKQPPKDASSNGGTCTPKAIRASSTDLKPLMGDGIYLISDDAPNPYTYYVNPRWISTFAKNADGAMKIIKTAEGCPSNKEAPIDLINKLYSLSTDYFGPNINDLYVPSCKGAATCYELARYTKYDSVVLYSDWLDKF